MIAWIAYWTAVAAVLLLLAHVRRRYPLAPKRVPLRIRIDGRASKQTSSRRWLWAAPAVMAALVVILGGFMLLAPPTPDQQVTIALVFVVLAEVAWFAAWSADRQIELARGMTYRIAPARTLRAFLPILATIAVTLFLAIRPS